MTNDLAQILLHFRVHPIGLVNDTEKAFLNIELKDEDIIFTKFLRLLEPGDPNSSFLT